MIDAATARLLEQNKHIKADAEHEVRVRTDVNRLLEKIQETAQNKDDSSRYIVFSTEACLHESEAESVRLRLQTLGFCITQQEDNGMHWEEITW